MANDCCSLRIVGGEDVTINQGEGINLAAGVYAYDADGESVPLYISPSEIDKCEVGEHLITYTARGRDNQMLPSLLCGENELSIPDICGDINTVTKERIVTIEQANPPVIRFDMPTLLEPGDTFDPLENVYARDDNGNRIEDISYYGKMDDMAEGDIASFETDLTDPLKSLQVFLDPVQDLNGYDAPWVGGAGKNFAKPTQRTFISNGVTYSVDADGKITLTGTATGATNFTLYTGQNAPETSQYTVSMYGAINAKVNGGNTYTTTVNSGASLSPFVISTTSGTTYNESFYVQIEKGSTATAYTPYENICPISGHDEVDVYDDPIYGGLIEWNQLVFDTYATVSNYEGVTTSYDVATHKFCIENLSRTANYSSGSARGPITSAVPVYGHKYVVLSDVDDEGIGIMSIRQPNAQVEYADINSIFEVTQNYDNYKWFILRINNKYDFVTKHPVGNKFYFTMNIIDLTEMFGAGNEPSTVDEFKALFPLDYYAYNSGTTTCVSAVSNLPYGHYTTQLGQTVYGGYIDLVSGVLTVDRAKVNLVGGNWSKSSSYPGGFYISNGQFPVAFNAPKPKDNTPFICSHAKTATTLSDYVNGTCYSDQSTNIRIMSADTTVSQWSQYLVDQNTAGTPVQVCYELATPQTYQLTAQQIQTLLGQNNIWSEDGRVRVIFTKSIPQGKPYEYPVEGTYEIWYRAEDECGNENTVYREIWVGEPLQPE